MSSAKWWPFCLSLNVLKCFKTTHVLYGSKTYLVYHLGGKVWYNCMHLESVTVHVFRKHLIFINIALRHISWEIATISYYSHQYCHTKVIYKNTLLSKVLNHCKHIQLYRWWGSQDALTWPCPCPYYDYHLGMLCNMHSKWQVISVKPSPSNSFLSHNQHAE